MTQNLPNETDRTVVTVKHISRSQALQ